MDDRRLRVFVVDDHDVVHWGFRVLLGEQPWVERFFQARTGAEALALARAHKPHVALVDLFLADESGAELCRGDPRGLAGDARAADLGRRAGCRRPPPAPPGPRGSSPRTGRRAGWRPRSGGSGSG